MKNALLQMLDALDELAESGSDEVLDTDVREQMAEAVHNALIDPEPGYALPDKFGMFSEEGNAEVKAILTRFLEHPEVMVAKKLSTPKARLDAFQDVTVESSSGNTYDEYFGYDDSFEE